ncbi:putative membrane protein [Desulfosporosinus sp. OT]|nr:putative membrane protein [Desulfosporosinus sp. OT]
MQQSAMQNVAGKIIQVPTVNELFSGVFCIYFVLFVRLCVP